MFLIDYTLALVCALFGLAAIVPVIRTRVSFRRYVADDGSPIAFETAEQMLADDPRAKVHSEWLSTDAGEDDKLAAGGWRRAYMRSQPLHTAMIGFGAVALLAASAALVFGLDDHRSTFAVGAFAAAGLFGIYGGGRLITSKDLRVNPFDCVHLFIAILALLAGLRLY